MGNMAAEFFIADTERVKFDHAFSTFYLFC